MTNFDRLCYLRKALRGLEGYAGPIAAVGSLPPGMDDDIFEALNAVKDRLEARIKEVEAMDDWDEEAV